MDSESPKVLPRSSIRNFRKRKANYVGQSPKEIPTNVSPATPTENGDGTSIWDKNFPFGDFIDKHFITEEDRKAFENWGIEECFHVLKATPVQEVSLIRLMEQKVGDLLKKNKAYDEENTELKNKLSESVNKKRNLKKRPKELILIMLQSFEREEDLIEENTKLKLKLSIKESIVNKMETETKDLKAEIEELKAKMEELRDEILLQQKAGFDKAIKQVLVSISELKP